MADTTLLFDILARDRASDAFNSAGRSADKLGDSTKRLGTVAKAALAAGAAAAATFALTIGRDAVNAAKENIKVSAQTDAAIKSTGGAANVTAKQLSKYTTELMMMSGVQDETIQTGANMLLTFTRVRNEVGKGNDIFNQATAAALNLSVAMGKDMQSSALLVGKALNDPIAGMTALTRAGVQFTVQQKEQIRSMVESGDVMGAQKLILAELETQFGGSAKAAGDAMTAGERLSLRWGEMQEQLGMWLIPKLDALINALVASAEWIGRNSDIIVPAVAILGSMTAAVIATSAAVHLLTGAAAAFGVTLNISLGPIALVVAAIAGLAAGLVYAYQKSETFRDIVDGAFRVVGRGIELYMGAASAAIGAVIDIMEKAIRTAKRAVDAITNIPGLGVAGDIAGGIGGFLGKLPGFDLGGVVPGPIGVPRLAVVHGGETVLPTHKGGAAGATFIINAPQPTAESIRRELERWHWMTGATA